MPPGEEAPAPSPPPLAPPAAGAAAAPRAQLSCTRFADALYFCYSPVYQVQQLYRRGTLDDCSGRWGALYDCMSLKAKPNAELEARPLACLLARACLLCARLPRACACRGCSRQALCAVLRCALCVRTLTLLGRHACRVRAQARLSVEVAQPCMWAPRTRDEAAAFWRSQFPAATDAEPAAAAPPA
jgi:hypothetical protein